MKIFWENVNGGLWLAVLSYIALMAGGLVLGNWLFSSFRAVASDSSLSSMLWVLIPVFVIYFIASALPFVPAAEIGFGLLVIFGGKIAPFVFITSALALITAFVFGRFVSIHRIARFLEYLGLERAPAYLRRLRKLSRKQRLALLLEDSPRRFGPLMLKYRYVAIVVLMNIPGNAIIGGGGGIALTAGLSGLFASPAFAISALLAVLPYPLFFFLAWLFGY
jgi:hypothetical protein